MPEVEVQSDGTKRVYNTSITADPTGRVVAKHRKVRSNFFFAKSFPLVLIVARVRWTRAWLCRQVRFCLKGASRRA